MISLLWSCEKCVPTGGTSKTGRQLTTPAFVARVAVRYPICVLRSTRSSMPSPFLTSLSRATSSQERSLGVRFPLLPTDLLAGVAVTLNPLSVLTGVPLRSLTMILMSASLLIASSCARDGEPDVKDAIAVRAGGVFQNLLRSQLLRYCIGRRGEEKGRASLIDRVEPSSFLPHLSSSFPPSPPFSRVRLPSNADGCTVPFHAVRSSRER